MKLILLAVILLLQQSVFVFACTGGCLCEDTVMRCRGFMPSKLQENTHHLYIEQFDLANLHGNSFSDDTFRELALLDINAIAGLSLKNGAFVGLLNLTHLGVHGQQLRRMEPSVFDGLNKLQTLDFSYNTQVYLDNFTKAMDTSTRLVLPSLTNLTLTEIQSHQINSIDIDLSLARSWFSNRRIDYIDLSGVNIGKLDFSVLFRLPCKSLKTIKLENVTLGFPKHSNFIPASECPSLRELDISSSYMPFIKHAIIQEIDCRFLLFFENIETFRSSAVFKTVIELNLYNMDFRNCLFHLQKLELRNNNLKWLNLTVLLHDTLKRSMSDVDISNNILEFIAPELLYPSENLKILRLSSNRLFVMQNNYPEQFEVLLTQSKHLQNIYIADNKLEHIPRDFFIGNEELEYIDLSDNKLTVCDFKLQHVRNIKYLDLHNNRIRFLDDATRVRLGHLFTNYNQHTPTNRSSNNTYKRKHSQKLPEENSDRTGQSYIRLASNPFSCTCRQESVRMLEWLQSAEYVDRADGNYTCDFENDTLNILGSAFTTVEAACAHKQMIRILSITLTVAIISVVVVSTSIVLYRRHLRKIKRYQEFLQDLNDDRLDRNFLVFLSFCAEDSEFVLNNIYQPIQTKLSEITGNNREFVCIGDREFRLGLNVQDEVMRCTEECSVVMFVISKEFCKKDWCRMEVGEAYYQRKPIIMFMKEHVEMDEMSSVLRRIFNRYTHAAWVNDDGVGHCEPNMQIICESIIELARKKSAWRM